MNMMNFLLQYLTQLHSKYLGQGHSRVKVTVLSCLSSGVRV